MTSRTAIVVFAAALAAVSVSAGGRPSERPPRDALARFDAMSASLCQLQTKEGLYDVSKLQNDKENYFIHVPGQPPTNYSINLCRDLVGPQPCQGLVQDCSACQVWQPTNGGYACLGAAQSAKPVPGTLPEQKTKGGLTIQYFGGSAGTSGQPRSYQVDFICDHSAGIGKPIFGSESPSLHYNIEWRSSFACLGYSCQFTDPKDGLHYDVSALTDKEVHFDCGSDKCWLRPCTTLTTPCGTDNVGSAVCQRFAPVQNGLVSLASIAGATNKAASTEKQIENGGFTQHLIHGTALAGHGERSTELRWVCNGTAVNTEPTLVAENPVGHYIFEWESVYACGRPAAH